MAHPCTNDNKSFDQAYRSHRGSVTLVVTNDAPVRHFPIHLADRMKLHPQQFAQRVSLCDEPDRRARPKPKWSSTGNWAHPHGCL